MALVEAARYLQQLRGRGRRRSRLAAEGIDSFIFDIDMTLQGVGFGVIPVRLMVDEDDLRRGRGGFLSAAQMRAKRR